MLALRLHRFLGERFLRRRSTPVRGPIHLVHRRVYVLPTRTGLAFSIALLLMLIGSINYQLSLGYMLTFLLAGTAVVGLLHTYRNLVHLRVEPGKVEDAFAGGRAHFQLHLHNPSHYARVAIEVVAGDCAARCDVPPRAAATVTLALPAAQRGWLPLPRLTLRTQYPLGLFSTWAYAHPDLRALVYPRPDDAPLPAPQVVAAHGGVAHSGPGNDDFHGLRSYHAGDPLRHIAWKAAAHSQVLLTKVFSGDGAAELWFDYDALPAALGREARLSRLARWVLLADAAGAAYGLRLPDRTIEPATGASQRERCLRALALYEGR